MKKILYKLIIIVILVGAIGASIYFYLQYQRSQKLLQNPTLVAAEETKSLIEKVGNLIQLPKGEQPTLATVSDKNKLADQPFFANSQNGDKVLIYTNAKKAILYRPSINKIIEVAPINNTVVNQSPSPAVSGTPAPTLIPTLIPTSAQKLTKVVVYNGTKTAGLATSYAAQLTDKISNIVIVSKGDTKGNYTSMLVVDLTGTSDSVAKQIALQLGGTVGALPKDEIKPNADILVIIGK